MTPQIMDLVMLNMHAKYQVYNLILEIWPLFDLWSWTVTLTLIIHPATYRPSKTEHACQVSSLYLNIENLTFIWPLTLTVISGPSNYRPCHAEHACQVPSLYIYLLNSCGMLKFWPLFTFYLEQWPWPW